MGNGDQAGARTMSSKERQKRRGIDGAARALRKAAEKAGKPITHETARRRVRRAVIHTDKQKDPRR